MQPQASLTLFTVSPCLLPRSRDDLRHGRLNIAECNACSKYHSNRAVAVAGWTAVAVISRHAVFLWVPAAVGEEHAEEGTTDSNDLLCCTTTIDQEYQIPVYKDCGGPSIYEINTGSVHGPAITRGSLVLIEAPISSPIAEHMASDSGIGKEKRASRACLACRTRKTRCNL